MANPLQRFLTGLLVALLCAAAPAGEGQPDRPAAAAPQASPPRLRLLTYNIHHGEGVDGKLDLPRIARVITAQKPDLVALQEVDVKTRRTGNVDQPAELARLTGMHAAFGKGIDYQGGEYGNAALSRFPVRATKVHPLPSGEGEERRCALVVTVKPWEGRPEVTFVATHLNYRNETERVREVEAIQRLLPPVADERPLILAGDLNARPDTPPIRLFAGHWKDAAAGAPAEASFTFPAEKPVRRIDYVMLRPAHAWRVVETSVVDEAVASDHRPVLAVVEWQPGAAGVNAANPARED